MIQTAGKTATLSVDELRELYRSLVLDHARNPRNFGSVTDATHAAEGINPMCGDKLRIELRIDDAGTIREAAFEGTGCAISLASASLMTETIIGLADTEALQWHASVTGSLDADSIPASASDLGPLQALQGVREFPARIKCATLAWHALDSAIHQSSQPASTE